ncbi:UPF0029-domain-containing protein [Coemansia reversa NRRL 1564]|uniref:UPF0029-domain-containing protein n=1 Tax=Coemansia reversa (strain ATCC 12441 / NRRL 1564) TaxID=763665 RepID=A0A2G5B998_COERN|nr:UPF0029-domain-containing protein [Coemansia reversa NRRL 1564]|eukprot:PIA15595.1 UPF0029-domain-containing protein [Coemansia reversa NRRL 1564]
MFILHAPLDAMEAQVDVRFYLPESYPSDSPPIFEWIGAKDITADINTNKPGFIYPSRQLILSHEMRRAASDELCRAWRDDMCKDVVIYGWITWLSEYLSGQWPLPLDPIPLPRDGDAKSLSRNTCQGQSLNTAPSSANVMKGKDDIGRSCLTPIFTGQTFEMKKSIFVAHVARVTTAEEVVWVRDALMEDKKIAQATHNILAYRIRLDGDSISQDNDDDGETAAGKRLGHLLQMLGAENIMVVVTRWYGGTHLGPDRFKLISNAARQALTASGYLEPAKSNAVYKRSTQK